MPQGFELYTPKTIRKIREQAPIRKNFLKDLFLAKVLLLQLKKLCLKLLNLENI